EGSEKALGKGAEDLSERELTGVAEGEVGTTAARDARVESTGHVENKALAPRDAQAQLEYLADNPHLIEGTPPTRRAKLGDHLWEEQPGGGWCRHSDGDLCTKLPKKLEKALQERAPIAKDAPVKEGQIREYNETTTKGAGVKGDKLTGD